MEIVDQAISFADGFQSNYPYTYIKTSIIPGESHSQNGCSCPSDTNCGIHCMCATANTLCPIYTPQKQLYTILHGIETSVILYECGPGCSCKGICPHSVLTAGPIHRLLIAPSSNRGYGVYAVDHIEKGSFVCEYAGEYILSDQEADRRLEQYDAQRPGTHALLIIKLWLPSATAGQKCTRLNVDATLQGNVARFLNHSCDGGNLQPELIVQQPGNSNTPRIALFAKRRIEKGEEITYAYGEPNAGNGRTSIKCYCGTSACLGFIPADAQL